MRHEQVFRGHQDRRADAPWNPPLHPRGDRVAGKIDLASRPGWGIVVSRNEGVNQNGETVLSFLGEVFVERRAPPARSAAD
jgi:hypothetical protein